MVDTAHNCLSPMANIYEWIETSRVGRLQGLDNIVFQRILSRETLENLPPDLKHEFATRLSDSPILFRTGNHRPAFYANLNASTAFDLLNDASQAFKCLCHAFSNLRRVGGRCSLRELGMRMHYDLHDHPHLIQRYGHVFFDEIAHACFDGGAREACALALLQAERLSNTFRDLNMAFSPEEFQRDETVHCRRQHLNTASENLNNPSIIDATLIDLTALHSLCERRIDLIGIGLISQTEYTILVQAHRHEAAMKFKVAHEDDISKGTKSSQLHVQCAEIQSLLDQKRLTEAKSLAEKIYPEVVNSKLRLVRLPTLDRESFVPLHELLGEDHPHVIDHGKVPFHELSPFTEEDIWDWINAVSSISVKKHISFATPENNGESDGAIDGWLDNKCQNIFRKYGECYEIRFQGNQEIALKGSVGLDYIHCLIKNQSHSFSPTELIAVLNYRSEEKAMNGSTESRVLDEKDTRGYQIGFGDSNVCDDPIADKQYINQVNQRIQDLKRSLKQAEKRSDSAAISKIKTEMNQVRKFKNTIVTPTGKMRRLDPRGEQDRKNVQGAIRRALKKIEEVNPVLHMILDRDIKTGKEVTYRPKELIYWIT